METSELLQCPDYASVPMCSNWKALLCRYNSSTNPFLGYPIAMHSVIPPGPYDTVQSALSDEVKMDTNPAYVVAGTIKMEDNPVYQTMTGREGVTVAPSGPYDTVSTPQFDKVRMDANPAYAATSKIKMEDNPAYQTMTTNPGGGGGAGSGVNYYEHIIDDKNVKMTENPAYAVL